MKFKGFNLAENKNEGYLLLEAIVALFILIVGFYGVFGLVTNSIGLNKMAGDQFVANYLAMEGIEVVKNLIDADKLNDQVWNNDYVTPNSGNSFEVEYDSVSLQSNQNRNLLFNPATGFYGYQSGNPTPFIRTININFISSSEVRVNSIVKWRSRGGVDFEINLEDHFFDWR